MAPEPEIATLEVLECSACGGAVPLVAGDVAKCVYCGAHVAIPPAYQALRDAESQRTAADATARALYARLAQPPGWILRVLADWFSPGNLALGLYLAMFIVGVLAWGGIEASIMWIAQRGRAENVFDTSPLNASEWTPIALGFAFAYLGTILGVLGQRHAISRGALQNALAARPPRLPGGASECRMCGAPLLAKEGAMGVACQYCRADNLLIVPSRWVKAVVERTSHVVGETASARDALADERARIRKKVRNYVLGLTAVAPIIVLMFSAYIKDRPRTLDDWPPHYALYRQAAVPLVGEYTLVDNVFRGRHSPARTRCVAGDSCIESTLPRPESYRVDVPREFRYYVALARGDTFALVAKNVADGASVRIERHVGRSWDDSWFGYAAPADTAPFGHIVLESQLRPGQRVEFRPDYDAWHLVAIRVPYTPSPPTLSLCIELLQR